MKEIDVQTLKKMKDEGQDFQLIDVREPNEYKIGDIGGELIPLGTITDEPEKIAKDKMVVIHCRSGKRSATAIMQLESEFGFENLYNLKGGIMAYADEIDDSVRV